MSKYTTFEVSCRIKTNYSIKELEEVLEKIFYIPGLQYDDCECFVMDRLNIGRNFFTAKKEEVPI